MGLQALNTILTHLSSTNLDSWSLQQLRQIKVAGNQSLADFFNKHGGSSLLPPGNNDARTRYSSRQANLYKEEIARRVAEDVRQNPNGIHIEGLDLTPMGSSTPAEKQEDFFESWDKAAPIPSPRPSRPSSTAPPSIGVPRTATPPAAATPAAPTAPRTVSSSALRSGAGARPAASSRLGGAPKASKLGGSRLGAKKASTGINFEEAQRKAIEEEERIKRLGYDKKKEEEEAAALKAREEEERRKNQAAGIANSRSATPLSKARAVVEDKPVPVKLGFGQVASAPVAPKPQAA